MTLWGVYGNICPIRTAKGGDCLPRSEALAKAQERYQAKLKQVKFWLNPATDRDVIARLDSVESKGKYITRLIREDIKKGGQK